MIGTDLAKASPANIIDPMAPGNSISSGSALRPFDRVGVPGYTIVGGYIQPNERDRRLVGQARYQLYSDNLVNVGIIGTGVRYFLGLVSGAKWDFEPADDSEAAEEIAQFCRDTFFEDMESPFERVIRRAAMFPFWGYSIQEWTAKKITEGPWAGRIGFDDIEARPQSTIERWDIGPNGKVRGVMQRNPNNGMELYLPMTKCIRLVDDAFSDSPEGVGLFRQLVKIADAHKHFEDLEALGYATDLQGIPIARGPLKELADAKAAGHITAEQVAQSRAVLDDFIRNHWRGGSQNTMGLVLDSKTYETTDGTKRPSSQYQWNVELLKSGGTSHAQINEAIKRKTFEMARVLGIEHILFGADGGGSLALASQGTKRLHGQVNSCLSEVQSSLQRQAVRPLMQINNVDRAIWPKIKPEEVAYRTVEEVVSVLTGLATAGAPIPPDDPAINASRTLVGLPRQDITHQITAGLIAMGAGAPEDDEEDGEGDDESGKSPRSGSGGKPKPAGKDPTRMLDELRGYIQQTRAGGAPAR